jgi:hypothetical protein
LRQKISLVCISVSGERVATIGLSGKVRRPKPQLGCGFARLFVFNRIENNWLWFSVTAFGSAASLPNTRRPPKDIPIAQENRPSPAKIKLHHAI